MDSYPATWNEELEPQYGTRVYLRPEKESDLDSIWDALKRMEECSEKYLETNIKLTSEVNVVAGYRD